MLGVRNEYQAALGDKLFADCPKRVLAAIAVSALTRGGQDLDRAAELLAYEWQVLALNGIVPQELPAKYRELAAKGGQEVPC